jgi:predicted nucleic acid-binding protein
MDVFIDTSAFIAVVNAGDKSHEIAMDTWRQILSSDDELVTTNYILVETNALLQHRMGMKAVRVFEREIAPALDVKWVEEQQHRAGMSALLVSGRRKLSLVDCVSFEVMRSFGLRHHFSFDKHFAEQGFVSI